MIWIVDNTIGL